MSTAIDFLKKHESVSPSHFEENAKWRKENKEWLRYSRIIAITMLDKMKELGLTKKMLAERIGCSQQYLDKIQIFEDGEGIEIPNPGDKHFDEFKEY